MKIKALNSLFRKTVSGLNVWNQVHFWNWLEYKKNAQKLKFKSSFLFLKTTYLCIEKKLLEKYHLVLSKIKEFIHCSHRVHTRCRSLLSRGVTKNVILAGRHTDFDWTELTPRAKVACKVPTDRRKEWKLDQGER